MTLETWFLLQQHAMKLDAAALLLFIRREGIARERRTRRLEPDWWTRNAKQAERDFHELFVMRPDGYPSLKKGAR